MKNVVKLADANKLSRRWGKTRSVIVTYDNFLQNLAVGARVTRKYLLDPTAISRYCHRFAT
jgi:hypothetical protein